MKKLKPLDPDTATGPCEIQTNKPVSSPSPSIQAEAAVRRIILPAPAQVVAEHLALQRRPQRNSSARGEGTGQPGQPPERQHPVPEAGPRADVPVLVPEATVPQSAATSYLFSPTTGGLFHDQTVVGSHGLRPSTEAAPRKRQMPRAARRNGKPLGEKKMVACSAKTTLRQRGWIEVGGHGVGVEPVDVVPAAHPVVQGQVERCCLLAQWVHGSWVRHCSCGSVLYITERIIISVGMMSIMDATQSDRMIRLQEAF